MKAKKMLVSLAAFVLSGFVIVYIIIQLISSLTTDVSYQYVAVQTVENTLETTGYIVRNESVVSANHSGIISYSAAETQKIGVNQLIATVYPSSHEVNLQNSIDRITRKIAVLKKSSVDAGYQTSDVSKIDEKIYSSLVKIRQAVTSNDLYLTEQYAQDVLVNFNKRHLITSNAKDYQVLIDQLNNQKNDLTASLQAPLETIRSEKSGYFTTLIDGYETVYTPSVVKNLTIDLFHELQNANRNEIDNLAIGKIISDFDWYTLCEVSKKDADEFVQGKKYPVTYLYSAGQKLNAFLEKKVTQTDSDTVVFVLKMEEVPADFDYTRMQTIRLIKDSTEGIGFPRSALRMVDGKQGVYVISGNSVGFKQVEIINSTTALYFSKEFSVGDPNVNTHLSRFDRVITEGKDLYVGKILD